LILFNLNLLSEIIWQFFIPFSFDSGW